MIGVIGAGAFGTALAVVQAAAGRATLLWGRDAAAIAETAARRENQARLPGVPLPEPLGTTADLADLAGAEILLLAVPAQATGAFLAAHGDDLPDVPLVLCAKGIDAATLRLQTEIAAAASPGHALAALTGPGFAGEIARGLPTALTLACGDPARGRALQAALAAPRLRLYLTDDVTGAELGGALKNVIAIACGMAEGAGLGHSARAALMTRGFAEMSRLAVEDRLVGVARRLAPHDVADHAQGQGMDLVNRALAHHGRRDRQGKCSARCRPGSGRGRRPPGCASPPRPTRVPPPRNRPCRRRG